MAVALMGRRDTADGSKRARVLPATGWPQFYPPAQNFSISSISSCPTGVISRTVTTSETLSFQNV